jgi:hypothetical protein
MKKRKTNKMGCVNDMSLEEYSGEEVVVNDGPTEEIEVNDGPTEEIEAGDGEQEEITVEV